jgi:poly-beta-1,6-N-acetyl-D-glucosamine synthase
MIIKFFSIFVFWYPLVMCTIWIIGGLLFYFRRERKEPLPLTETPMVSILIPCYNEQSTITETIRKMSDLNYPNYEIIAINDGSKDNTAEILANLSKDFEKLRVIDLKVNSGKANALQLGLIASNGEIIVGVDADSYLDKDALRHFVPHFTTKKSGERVGAVTGNPRVRNRSSLLAKVQLCEFASIIGLIKRSQRILGKVMTVSGVVVAFRKRALLDCGLWDRDLVTEDIGVTWKLQKRFWDVRYEPRAICWMLVPETIKGLWNQRVRWAQGGIEVILRHWNVLFDWRYRRLAPIYFEQVASILWSISWVTLLVITFFEMFIINQTPSIPIFWSGAYLAVLCLIQFAIALSIEGRYDQSFFKYYLWSIWYPIFYWYFNAFVIIRALPKAIFKRRKTKLAVWDSPDRGIGL